MSVWAERKLATEEQEVIISPNESYDGIILLCREVEDVKSSFRVYLSYEEAIILSSQLLEFAQNKY